MDTFETQAIADKDALRHTPAPSRAWRRRRCSTGSTRTPAPSSRCRRSWCWRRRRPAPGDASPRGDAPGFVAILDDHRLLIPDRIGNNRVDSYGNLVERPGVGLLFFVPGIDETLRVNGRARLLTDADTLAAHAVQGRPPRAGLLIAVDEVFFHCGKALKRSRLWDPETKVPRADFPASAGSSPTRPRAARPRTPTGGSREAPRNRLY